MAEKDDSDEMDETAPLQLSGAGRFWMALLGVGLTGAGAVAVFKTTNQAGTAALIVLGGLLLLLGLVGRFPERGAVGSANWEYRPLRRLLKSENPEVREAVAGEVLAIPEAAQNQPLRAQARRVMRESVILDSLEDFLIATYPQHVIRREARIKVADPLRPTSHYVVRADLVIESSPQTQPAWAVPLELRRRVTNSALYDARRCAEVFGSKFAVLAVLDAPPDHGEVTLNEYDGVTVMVARFARGKDNGGIREAIDRAIEQARLLA